MAKVYDNPEKYDNGKMTPMEWAEHIWYHYKWVLIIGACVVVFLLITVTQFFTNKSPDVSIMHVGPMYITPTAHDEMADTLATFSKDYNDDGEIKTDILDITVNKFTNEDESFTVNFDQNNESLRRFQVEIRSGDSVIYLLDEYYFDICIDEGLLTPLNQIIDDAYMPENVISGYGVKLSQLDVYSLPGLRTVPEGAVLCIRTSPEYDESIGRLTYSRSMEAWENNLLTFKKLIEYRKEQ